MSEEAGALEWPSSGFFEQGQMGAFEAERLRAGESKWPLFLSRGFCSPNDKRGHILWSAMERQATKNHNNCGRPKVAGSL